MKLEQHSTDERYILVGMGQLESSRGGFIIRIALAAVCPPLGKLITTRISPACVRMSSCVSVG